MVVAFVALRLLDLALFLQQEHRGSTRLKVPLGLHGALQLAPCFLSCSLVAIYPKACSDAGRSVAGRSHSVR